MEVTGKSQNINRILKKEVPKNPEIYQKYTKRYQEKQKRCDKVENSLKQIKQGSYYICTIFP